MQFAVAHHPADIAGVSHVVERVRPQIVEIRNPVERLPRVVAAQRLADPVRSAFDLFELEWRALCCTAAPRLDTSASLGLSDRRVK